MRRVHPEPAPVAKMVIRCAIYTRKSTEEKLEQEFNSLDAQREAAQAYIASQKADGWVAVPDKYDDGGFSGGNMERPALDRLVKDIEAGKVDCVVVYKVDRLSRSLLDFARLMGVFERHQVSFVSVTQHFNTTHSMGRLTLNILLSFAQFEREIISERIRDKIGAQKRKGKWAGGIPVLGYDVDRSGPSPKLVVNHDEAARVRKIFDLYLELGALLPTVHELNRRGWANKLRQTKRGIEAGGRPFDKPALHSILTNPVYIGKIVHKGQGYDGEHLPIITPEVFAAVQDRFRQNRHSGGPLNRNKYGALLRGLLHCACCGRAMVHNFSGKVGKAGQHYRYYTCTTAIKCGRVNCPGGRLPAMEIERVVLDQVRCIGSDPQVQADVVAQSRSAIEDEQSALESERDDVRRNLARLGGQVRKLASGAATSAAAGKLAEFHQRIQALEARESEATRRLETIAYQQLNESEVKQALKHFDKVWDCLSPRKRVALLLLLIVRVDYDATESTVTVKFHPTGIKSLAGGQLGEAA